MNNIPLLQEELETGINLYNKRIEYLIKLGEVKLSEITNQKTTEETYFNLTELNTREEQFLQLLNGKYGPGRVELNSGCYIKNV